METQQLAEFLKKNACNIVTFVSHFRVSQMLFDLHSHQFCELGNIPILGLGTKALKYK